MERSILIKSCQKNKCRQEACSKTWVHALRNKGIPIWFVEGGYEVETTDNYCLQLNCGDDYMANSFKVKRALTKLLELSTFTHLFICDDDTFIHPQRWFEHLPQGEFECLMTMEIPWCHGGGGWYMSRKCCELYAGLVSKRGSWDDQMASQLIEHCGIPITVRPDLYSQWENKKVANDNSLITCHPVQPVEMYKLCSHLLNGST